MSSYNPFDDYNPFNDFEDFVPHLNKLKKCVRFDETLHYEEKIDIDTENIIQDIVCDKCNSKMPTENQLICHKMSCTGRTSFMRLSNNHPEYHLENEVFWIISKYIDKQMKQGKNNADMPIGIKYLPYAQSIEKSLQNKFNQVQFKILYKTDTQIVIRCSW